MHNRSPVRIDILADHWRAPASSAYRWLRQRQVGTLFPVSDRSLCLRTADRRQAQAAFGGRFARLDPGQPSEAWLGIGFRVSSGSPSCGGERCGRNSARANPTAITPASRVRFVMAITALSSA